jgi:MFS family permease
VLLVVASGWALTAGGLVTLPALLPYITDAFDLSNTAAGVAVTAMWGAYALLQFPAGLLTDHLGERATLAASVATMAAGVAALAVVPSYVVFVLAGALLGLGAGLYATPRVTVLSETFPENDGTALGVTLAAGSVGSAALPLTAGWLAAFGDFRLAFAVFVPLYLLAAVAAWLTVPTAVRSTESATDVSVGHVVRRLVDALTTRAVLLAAGAMTCTFFIYQGLTAFFTTYLVSVKGLGPGAASTMYSAFFVAAALSQPLAGNAADNVGHGRVLVAITGAYAVVLALMPGVSGLVALVPVVLALGAQRGSSPVMNAYIAAVLPEDVKGSGYGLLRTVFTGLASLAPVTVGVLADTGRFDVAFYLLAGLAAVATALYYLLPSVDDA